MLLLNSTHYSIRPCQRESRLKLPSVLSVLISSEIIQTRGLWTDVILFPEPRMVILGNHGNVANHDPVAVLEITDELLQPYLLSARNPYGLCASCSPEHLIAIIRNRYSPFRHFNFPRPRRDTIPMREEYLKMNTFLSENSDRKISDRNSFFNRQTFQDAENKLVVWSLLAGMSFLLYGILYTI